MSAVLYKHRSNAHQRPTFNLDANGQWEPGIAFIIIVVVNFIISVIRRKFSWTYLFKYRKNILFAVDWAGYD